MKTDIENLMCRANTLSSAMKELMKQADSGEEIKLLETVAEETLQNAKENARLDLAKVKNTEIGEKTIRRLLEKGLAEKPEESAGEEETPEEPKEPEPWEAGKLHPMEPHDPPPADVPDPDVKTLFRKHRGRPTKEEAAARAKEKEGQTC